MIRRLRNQSNVARLEETELEGSPRGVVGIEKAGARARLKAKLGWGQDKASRQHYVVNK